MLGRESPGEIHTADRPRVRRPPPAARREALQGDPTQAVFGTHGQSASGHEVVLRVCR